MELSDNECYNIEKGIRGIDMNKKQLIYLIGIIVLIISITKFAMNLHSINVYEKSRIADVESLAEEYKLADAVVKFEHTGNY